MNSNKAWSPSAGGGLGSPLAGGILPNISASYTHPHPDPAHVMRQYRRHVLHFKRRYGTARSLIHYRKFVDTYLAAKRKVLGVEWEGK